MNEQLNDTCPKNIEGDRDRLERERKLNSLNFLAGIFSHEHIRPLAV